MKHVEVIIRGIVQGVFFRSFVSRNAKILEIRGEVWNRSDGSVGAIFEGKEDQLEQILKLCSQGPPHSSVESVSITSQSIISHSSFDSFTIRY